MRFYAPFPAVCGFVRCTQVENAIQDAYAHLLQPQWRPPPVDRSGVEAIQHNEVARWQYNMQLEEDGGSGGLLTTYPEAGETFHCPSCCSKGNESMWNHGLGHGHRLLCH